ncbi:MAG TPA: nuclear transport factor 2 family protein [Nevskia sp.]|nr:nuclear transport factor 2 family protein [Nevskia sp.]
MLKLLIGNQRFSSWSLRAWLLLKQLGIPFEAQVLPYTRGDWNAAVKSVHAAGTVPVLLVDSFVVGDSLAIAETLAEMHPQAGVWPAEAQERVMARALCAEIHASFGALRTECSFDLFRDGTPRPLSAQAAAQLARVDRILAAASEGGFLFGAFCAADAFYIPVALRVLQYGLEVSLRARAYIERATALPALKLWIEQAQGEREWPAQSPGGRPYHRAVVSGEDALRLAQRWVQAWNARRLDTVLEFFAEDAVFLSPKAESFIGQARVEGQSALRSYWTTALHKITELEFTLETADWDAATATLLVVYVASLNGKRARACERWVLQADGRIRYGEAYYGASA